MSVGQCKVHLEYSKVIPCNFLNTSSCWAPEYIVYTYNLGYSMVTDPVINLSIHIAGIVFFFDYYFHTYKSIVLNSNGPDKPRRMDLEQ